MVFLSLCREARRLRQLDPLVEIEGEAAVLVGVIFLYVTLPWESTSRMTIRCQDGGPPAHVKERVRLLRAMISCRSWQYFTWRRGRIPAGS